jgi:hypothetical protein
MSTSSVRPDRRRLRSGWPSHASKAAMSASPAASAIASACQQVIEELRELIVALDIG